jgi:hypothetical protein
VAPNLNLSLWRSHKVQNFKWEDDALEIKTIAAKTAQDHHPIVVIPVAAAAQRHGSRPVGSLSMHKHSWETVSIVTP